VVRGEVAGGASYRRGDRNARGCSSCAGFQGESGGHSQGQLRTPQELTQEVHGRMSLLAADPPHRLQDRLRSCTYPGPAATPELARDHPDTHRQLDLQTARKANYFRRTLRKVPSQGFLFLPQPGKNRG
jgi:hypothetical protein